MLTLGRRLPKDSALQNSVRRLPTDGLPCHLAKSRDRLFGHPYRFSQKRFQYQPRRHIYSITERERIARTKAQFADLSDFDTLQDCRLFARHFRHAARNRELERLSGLLREVLCTEFVQNSRNIR